MELSQDAIGLCRQALEGCPVRGPRFKHYFGSPSAKPEYVQFLYCLDDLLDETRIHVLYSRTVIDDQGSGELFPGFAFIRIRFHQTQDRVDLISFIRRP